MLNITPWVLYLSVGIIFIALEAFTPSLLFLPLALGLFVAAIASLFIGSVYGPLILGVIFTISIYFIFAKLGRLGPSKTKTISNMDSLIGREGLVTNENGTLSLKIYGDIWKLSSETPLKVNQKVKVLKVDGNKLFVEQSENAAD